MHIKSIELNGFKSYGTKTEIHGFDPFFNAITGLNGSGKSNILDSICFVLGISNLQQVRATNLQDLVYKSGQAGITKASVSIVFDNSDVRNSPVGYENVKEITVTRIVIIGGRNKYLINGTVANNTRIQDFFQSVGLNVNNPHFLIMQGRITKVLNMKPIEILSMVEEAAGTRMYESKKEISLKLMAKKDDRLREIDSILSEDITPNLTKLREERKDYIEYTKIVREYDHLIKLLTAWQFMQAQKMNLQSIEDAKKIEEDLNATEKKIEECKSNIEVTQQKVVELEKIKDAEIGGTLQALEEELKNEQMEETMISNRLKNCRNQLKDDNKKNSDLNKQLKEEKELVLKKEELLSGKVQVQVNNLKRILDADNDAKEAALKRLKDINAGLYANDDGESATLAAQLMTAQEELANAKTSETVAKNKLPFLTKDLTQKQAENKGADSNFKKLETDYNAMEKEVKILTESIKKLNFNECELDNLTKNKCSLEKDFNTLRENLDTMQSKFPHLTFEYKDPVKNFDRKKVHGLVCNLFKVQDLTTMTALEIAAGSRLYNVVVEDDTTGKLLLDRGQLKQRCTLIPLNKIQSNAISKKEIDMAKSLVNDKNHVHSALSLLNYDHKIAGAMEFVFGGVFICNDMDTARKVAFHEGNKRRCVTLDGEVFDPAGTISGGSMNQRSNILTELSRMNEIKDSLNSKTIQYQKCSSELKQKQIIAEKYSTLQEDLDIKASNLEHLRNQLEGSTFHQQKEEIALLKKSIEEQKTIISDCRHIVKNAETKVQELQMKINNEQALRDQVTKEASSAVDEWLTKVAISEKNYSAAQQDYEQLVIEIGEIKESCVSYENQLSALGTELRQHENEIAEMELELNNKKNHVASVSEKVKAQKSVLKKHVQDVAKMYKEIDGMKKEVEDAMLHKQQLEHDAAKSKADSKDAQNNVEKFLSAYPWIEEEKKYFGVANSEYDFTDFNASQSSARLKKLEETKNKLGQSINTRAQSMLQNAEEQYRDLMGKKKTVLHDKEKIQVVIAQLDKKKKEALRTASLKVNHDFGSIFSTLLPGAKAQLVPHEDENVITGLSFNVGFGDVWKESLTELSGGQRSLVALSLILSLLLFKPAPIYILDEVDAALDLSHTQNIGTMLKKHFDKSQFVVVSLKDGMFNNANVLFKTKFVDGMSTVTRTTADQLQL